MRAFVIYVVLIFFTATVLGALAIECIWGAFGECMERCPPDTYSYTPGCVMTMSRRTCRAPVARLLGQRCDYSRCDCAVPKVWDEAAKKCVLLRQCSDQSELPENDQTVDK